jgi:hypothetical protein
VCVKVTKEDCFAICLAEDLFDVLPYFYIWAPRLWVIHIDNVDRPIACFKFEDSDIVPMLYPAPLRGINLVTD